jgi:hypothetical protein
LIECEFPVLESLNKLGDGSLRSALEAEEANISFVSQLVRGISPPLSTLMGRPQISIVVSSAASNSFLSRVKNQVKGVTVYSLKDEVVLSQVLSKDDICIFMTPCTRSDYQTAVKLAESSTVKAVVLINGYAKVRDLRNS